MHSLFDVAFWPEAFKTKLVGLCVKNQKIYRLLSTRLTLFNRYFTAITQK